jgi:hypothetical protein
MSIAIGTTIDRVAVRQTPAELKGFYARVIAGGGTILDYGALREAVLDYRAISALNPSLYTFASGRKAGTLYSLVPDSGAGDFGVTRSGTTAMELNAQGFWQPVGENVPRFSYEGGEPGILVEEARTNLITYPQSFANAYWAKSGARIEGDPSTAGADILSGWDFTNWDLLGATVNNNNTFTSSNSSGQGIRKNNILNPNKLYRFTITGITTSVGLSIRNYAFVLATDTVITTIAGAFSVSFYKTMGDAGIFLRNSTDGETTITTLTVQEVQGFSSPFVDANGVNLRNAYKFVATGANGYIRLTTALTVTAAATYTNSIFIKRVTGSGTVYLIDINTADRAITVTNDWTRVEYAAVAGSTSGQTGIKCATSGDEVLICYAPVEAAATASSPIFAAEGSTSTRNADVIVKTGASALIGQTEGSAVIEIDVMKLLGTATRSMLFLSEGTGSVNRIGLVFSSTAVNIIRFFISSGSTITADFTYQATTTGIYKIAVAWKANDSNMFINGVEATEVSNGAVSFSATLQQITVGCSQASAAQFNDLIDNLQLFPTRLSDAKLLELSTV